jgi:hypothetical protein
MSLVSSSVFSQAYQIDIAVNTTNDTVFLGHFRGNNERPLVSDTVVLRNGKGTFGANRQLPRGIYFLVCDGKMLFDFVIGDNQRFSIEADSADFLNLIKFTSSPENDVFYDFKRDNVSRQRQAMQLNEQFRAATTDDQRNELRTQRQELDKQRLKYLEDLIENNPNTFVAKFIRATIPIETYMPAPPVDEDGNLTDPSFQYRWWRKHFFDNFDIYDVDLLRTEIYDRKLMEYITTAIPQMTDTICFEIDKILTKAHQNDELFRYIMVTFFNHYSRRMREVIVDRGVVPENVYVHLAQKWFIPHAHWATEETIANVQKFVDEKSPNLIGKYAPPMETLMVLPQEHFRAAALDTAIKFDLHAGRMINDFRKELLTSKFTVLYFWDHTCGHCRTSIRELYNVWEEFHGSQMQVITVQILVNDKAGKGRWVDFVNENDLFGWINAWSPYSYQYKELYHLPNVPVIYLLDENGNIVMRGIGVEQVKDFFKTQADLANKQ